MKKFFLSLASRKNCPVYLLPLALILWLLSGVYGAGLFVVKLFYRLKLLSSIKLDRPVISVGNITLGGVGKTPLVEYIVEVINKKKKLPAVLIRGYMDIANSRSDEAAMLLQRFPKVPVVVGADRAVNAATALKNNPIDAFILDDGFQHWRIKRDLDIVVVDGTEPFGNGYLIPRGILREPKVALARADIIALTKSDLIDELSLNELKSICQKYNPSVLLIETTHSPAGLVDVRTGEFHSIEYLKGKRTCSFCSIGNPRSFELTLKKMGVELFDCYAFVDHHAYDVNDLQRIILSGLQLNVKTFITTEKDAVKVRDLMAHVDHEIDILALRIKLSLTDKNKENDLLERIDHLL